MPAHSAGGAPSGGREVPSLRDPVWTNPLQALAEPWEREITKVLVRARSGFRRGQRVPVVRTTDTG